MNYYVYAYLDLDGEPYYVGKGKGKRYLADHYKVPVPSEEYIRFFQTGMIEEEAFVLERKLIRFYGREGIEPGGILLNRTSGGNGTFSPLVSEETKRKLSASAKKPKSQKHRDNIRKARLRAGKHNADRIANIRKGMGCGTYKFVSPCGKVVEIDNLSEFCRNNGLQQSNMSLVKNGKQQSHKGWTLP
jgi:hypothetical protein